MVKDELPTIKDIVKLIFGIGVSVGLSGLANVFASQETRTLFGMECEVVRIPNYQQVQSPIYSGDYSDLLQQLQPKGYQRIDMFKTFSIGGKEFSVIMGQKCDRPMVRINGEEAVNDIGVDRIKQEGNSLIMMGTKNGIATMITCKMSTLSGNTQNILTGSLSPSKTGELFSGDTLPEKKTISDISRLSVSKLVEYFGGNWKRDQLRLANMIGIKNYQGTKSQNMRIQAYLLTHGWIPRVPTETPEKEVSRDTYQHMQHTAVSDIAHFIGGYTWPKDRRGLSLEAGVIDPYWGKKFQNMQIRSMLLKKIKIKITQ